MRRRLQPSKTHPHHRQTLRMVAEKNTVLNLREIPIQVSQIMTEKRVIGAPENSVLTPESPVSGFRSCPRWRISGPRVQGR